MKNFKFYDLLTLRDHLSPSFITTMLSCSMKAVLGSVLKVDAPNKNRSPALLMGNIMHKALEYYFLKMKAREITDSRTMLGLAIAEAIKYYEAKAKYYDSNVLQSALDFFKSNTQLVDSLSEFLDMNFLNKVKTADKFIKTELAFTKTKIHDVNFDGRIDLIFDTEVTDFKTTSKNMAASKDETRKENALLKIKRECALQLIIYKRALAQMRAENHPDLANMPEIKTFSVIEIIFTKNVPINYHVLTLKEVEEVAHELEERIDIVLDALKHKRIYRNFRDTMCPCEYATYCMDERNLNMILSKLDLPQDFF